MLALKLKYYKSIHRLNELYMKHIRIAIKNDGKNKNCEEYPQKD